MITVVRDALATNLCPYWPLCHMITGFRDALVTNLLPENLCASGPRYSRDQPFARDWPLCHIDWWSATLSRPTLLLDTWSATLSRPTLLLETGLCDMNDDDDTGDDDDYTGDDDNDDDDDTGDDNAKLAFVP